MPDDLPVLRVRRWDESYANRMTRATRQLDACQAKPETREIPESPTIPFRDSLMAGDRFYYDLDDLLRQRGAPRPALAD